MMTKANTKYKTVKRKANVGERILITNEKQTRGKYVNGDTFYVRKMYNGFVIDGVLVADLPDDDFIIHEEYEVIIGESSSDSERITALESQVAELQTELQTLKKRKKPKHLLTHYPTPNEQRKAVIERAKAFVTEHSAEIRQHRLLAPRFFVNSSKRTVVCLLDRYDLGYIHAKGIAKCAPDDVFNADIGKAIALGRALGLDVSEFENAVKPTKAVVGQYVDSLTYPGDAEQVSSITADRVYVEDECFWMVSNVNKAYRITDDTEAQY